MPVVRNVLGAAIGRAARLPLSRVSRPPFEPPRKALILQPCCLGRVMLTTPLLAALSEAFPEARFDWAISDWALQAISTNPRLTRTIRTGPGDLAANSREEMGDFLEIIRDEAYDTCFIPSNSGVLARAAWRARIPRRVGLNAGKFGFAHTVSVEAPAGAISLARAFLSLAAAVGVDEATLDAVEMEFEPPDVDRAAITRWLVEEVDWLGDVPLVILHPGGGENPVQTNLNKRWPVFRFARLGNHLARALDAKIVLVGTANERALADEVAGLMSFPVSNRAGQIGLGELGALAELASLYVGNDVGSTYIAAATGCPTLAIYGPTNPAFTAPYMVNGRVRTLWQPYDGEFDWTKGVTVEDVTAAADELMAAHAFVGIPKN